LSDDFTPIPPVIVHAIEELQSSGEKIDNVCCVYATAPLLQPLYLKEGLDKLLEQTDVKYAFSATRFSFPIQRAIRKLANSGVSPYDEQNIAKRSQDLEETYHDAGQFVWGTVDAWLSSLPIFAAHSRMIELPNHLVQDIDTLEDWHRAELLHKLITEERTN
jgi:N-acylneuraminate cytidylyltransferase